MKKIIDGRKYDTETAQCVGEFDNGLSRRDFRWCEEGLYKKRTGEFFLAGEGGGLSKYRYNCPSGGYCEGSKIIPLTLDEAKAWVEENLSYGDYIDLFGEPEE